MDVDQGEAATHESGGVARNHTLAAHAGDRRDPQVGRRASGAAACRENIRIDNRGFCIERQDAAGKILRKIASAAL